jgi:hypothetical protein
MITCQIRTSEGGWAASIKRATITMRATAPLSTRPIGMEEIILGGCGTSECSKRERGGEDMGTLLRGCKMPPVQQSTRSS